MVSTFTPNIQLEEPARGDQVGVWDTPVNANMTLIDLITGGITTINGAAGSVVLAAAQYQCKTITINSTLIASISLTLPTSFKKSYEIQNLCTGSSAFTITLLTTAAGGQAICAPPGEIVDVLNDGTNLKFKNMDRVGAYWDYGGSSAPIWVTGCTVPPYLNCDGTVFSSATYPQLTTVLGGTTLPDSRGRSRAVLNQGTARINSSNNNTVDGNTRFSGGGSEFVQNHNHGVIDPGHQHPFTAMQVSAGAIVSGGTGAQINPASVNTGSTTTGITLTTYGSGGSQNMPPTYIGGVTLIRAA